MFKLRVNVLFKKIFYFFYNALYINVSFYHILGNVASGGEIMPCINIQFDNPPVVNRFFGNM